MSGAGSERFMYGGRIAEHNAPPKVTRGALSCSSSVRGFRHPTNFRRSLPLRVRGRSRGASCALRVGVCASVPHGVEQICHDLHVPRFFSDQDEVCVFAPRIRAVLDVLSLCRTGVIARPGSKLCMQENGEPGIQQVGTSYARSLRDAVHQSTIICLHRANSLGCVLRSTRVTKDFCRRIHSSVRTCAVAKSICLSDVEALGMGHAGVPSNRRSGGGDPEDPFPPRSYKWSPRLPDHARPHQRHLRRSLASTGTDVRNTALARVQTPRNSLEPRECLRAAHGAS